MHKFLERFGAVALVGWVCIQFVGPGKFNRRIDPAKTIEAHTSMPAGVSALLHRACYDCHSDQTRWRWYARVAPFSWLQSADVSSGRLHLNYSQWSTYTDAQKKDRLNGTCKLIGNGEMPLWFYKPLHPESWLSADEKKQICAWTESEMARLPTTVTRERPVPQPAAAQAMPSR